MRTPWFKHVLFVAFLLMLSFPALQGWWGWWEEVPLGGAYKVHPKPDWVWGNWWKTKIQHETEAYAKQQFGWQPNLVRMHNQYVYEWFGQSPNSSLFLGQSGYWFEDVYTDAYQGLDYEGRDDVREIVEHLEVIQQELKKRGKAFVFLLAPSKARYVPEHLPTWCTLGDSTNYDVFLQEAAGRKINIIDVNAWFQREKATTPYPLFPINGTHWTVYGMHKVVDSLLHYLDHVTGYDLPEVVIDSLWTTTDHQDPDNDIERKLNMTQPLPHTRLAYYRAHYHTAGKWRPKVLVIGDSFWGTFYNKPNFLSQDCFEQSTFWYYNATVYPGGQARTSTDLSTLFKADVVIFEVTSAHLEGLGWGALNEFKRVLQAGTSDVPQEKIQAIIDQIRANPEWYNSLIPKAAARGISMDSMLYVDAVWMYNQQQ